MGAPVKLMAPLATANVEALAVGDRVLLYGTIYTARDVAHRRLVELLQRGEDLPVALEGQIIYYVGPTPPAGGRPAGSAGPTTSSRMDPFTPALLGTGVRVLIGKGDRGEEVVEALKQHQAVYLAAVGGAGALLAKCIKSAEVVAWPELGTEAVYRLEVEEFPAVVAIDTQGGNIYRR